MSFPLLRIVNIFGTRCSQIGSDVRGFFFSLAYQSYFLDCYAQIYWNNPSCGTSEGNPHLGFGSKQHCTFRANYLSHETFPKSKIQWNGGEISRLHIHSSCSIDKKYVWYQNTIRVAPLVSPIWQIIPFFISFSFYVQCTVEKLVSLSETSFYENRWYVFVTIKLRDLW